MATAVAMCEHPPCTRCQVNHVGERGLLRALPLELCVLMN
jgi:hypothetical protein